MKKRLVSFWLITLTIVCFCGCTDIAERERYNVSETTGGEERPYPVTAENLVFNSSPETVGSLSPAVTEMIFELGFGGRLVCRSSYCDHPKEAESIPEAGSGANPDIDRIIACSPALLITQSPIANKDVARLGEAGISVLMLPSPSSLEELYGCYESLSMIFNGSVEGEAAAEQAVSGLKSAVSEAKGSCESAAFIMNVSEGELSAATGDTFAGDFVSVFGRNIAGNSHGFSLSAEELINADPQVIFLANPLKTSDIDYEITSRLTAFSEGHVYVIDASLTERPTSRLAGLIRSVSETLREDMGAAVPAVTAETANEYGEIPEDIANSPY
ncbi:MAG: helical backbone metal receptor [Ruminococcus sp.]|nr:helical backbone metal receptor [Ruminococcus sp.]